MAPKRPAPKGPKFFTGLYTTYGSRGVAEYDGQKADVLHIHIRLLPVATSADPHIRLLQSSVS